MMKNIIKEEAIKLHRQLWRWIAEETEKQGCKVDKDEYFETMGIDEKDIPFNACYCCEFDMQASVDPRFCGSCKDCPLDWGAGYEVRYKNACCEFFDYPDKCKAGYYKQWYDTESPEEAARLAKIIAELPRKEETVKH